MGHTPCKPFMKAAYKQENNQQRAGEMSMVVCAWF